MAGSAVPNPVVPGAVVPPAVAVAVVTVDAVLLVTPGVAVGEAADPVGEDDLTPGVRPGMPDSLPAGCELVPITEAGGAEGVAGTFDEMTKGPSGARYDRSMVRSCIRCMSAGFPSSCQTIVRRCTPGPTACSRSSRVAPSTSGPGSRVLANNNAANTDTDSTLTQRVVCPLRDTPRTAVCFTRVVRRKALPSGKGRKADHPSFPFVGLVTPLFRGLCSPMSSPAFYAESTAGTTPSSLFTT